MLQGKVYGVYFSPTGGTRAYVTALAGLLSCEAEEIDLTAREEREYLERAAQGDLEARNVLIERNLRLVAHIMKKYYTQTSDQEDLISIGTIGLIKGISTFDPKKGARLATYAARCVENAMHPPGRHFPFRLTKRDRCASSDPVF